MARKFSFNSLSKRAENNHKIIIALFFILFFIIGISIFRDYGLSWDESISRNNGIISYRYVFEGDKALFEHTDKDYGVAFELPLVIVEKMFHLADMRDIYLARHLFTFLLFYISVYFFYLICKKHFSSWKIGLLGATFLILSPRIFADSFYNSKDLPFLSISIISIYTLVRYLDKKSLFKASLHALACAILVDIRIMGILIPNITLFFIFLDTLKLKLDKKSIDKNIKSLILYLALLAIFVIIFWPWLWENPLNFIEAFKNMSKFRWDSHVLYFGDYIKGTEIPWHYIPCWILITTPLAYIFFFFIGVIKNLASLIKDKMKFYSNNKISVVFLLWFFLPLFIVKILKSVLYDGWRHMFFIYPTLLIISIEGITSSFKLSKAKFKPAFSKIMNIFFVLIITLSLIPPATFMIKNHPYQNIYFNILAGRDLRYNFDLDYWGLSYRQALEYILKNDSRDLIKVNATNLPGKTNIEILSSEDRRRLMYVEEPKEADYYLSNYRDHREDYPYKDKFYSIDVNGATIMVVYKLD